MPAELCKFLLSKSLLLAWALVHKRILIDSLETKKEAIVTKKGVQNSSNNYTPRSTCYQTVTNSVTRKALPCNTDPTPESVTLVLQNVRKSLIFHQFLINLHAFVWPFVTFFSLKVRYVPYAEISLEFSPPIPN